MAGEAEEICVCSKCFNEPALQQRIKELQPEFSTGSCDFHPDEEGIPLSVAADVIDAALRENYGGAPESGREYEPGGMELDELIYDVVRPNSDELARLLKEHLEENDQYWPPDGEEAFYSDEYLYFETVIGSAQYGTKWGQFRDQLMHEQRFFNRSAFDYLTEIFNDVESRVDEDGKSPIYMINPGDPQSKFFRARAIGSMGDVKKYREDVAGQLGPPPPRMRSAGRLNPSGVAVFYAAFDPVTCVAELRPSVGSLVGIAEFKIEKPICVLDTTRYTAAPQPSSIFQKGALNAAAQWNFMRTFMRLISRPIRPGEEHIAYIPTQAVAEFLAFHHQCLVDGEKRHIDAIIFASAQNNDEGVNIALIGPAATTGIIGKDGKTYTSREAEKKAGTFGHWIGKDIDLRITPIEKSFEAHEVQSAKYKIGSHYSHFAYLTED